MNFKSEINWENKIKACKVFLRKDKNNKQFFVGDLTKTIKVIIQKNNSQYAKEGEWIISFVPVIFKKVENDIKEIDVNENFNFEQKNQNSEDFVF
jgi:hypothetical protein